MRHAMDHRKLGRNPAHRKALLRNLMNALVLAERIETTVPRAKELRRLADRVITLGKRATLHSRRRLFSLLCDKAATDKVFATLAGRFSGRAGGYTRIVRTGYRVGDGAEMAIIEYLPVEEKMAGAKGKKKAKPAGKKPTAKTAAAGKGPERPSRTGGRKAKAEGPKETKPRTSGTRTKKTPEA
ncbi:MAG: hypothetical protein OHK0028_06330 [Deltaproteobacteria bacterium]